MKAKDGNRTTYICKFQMTYTNQGVYKSNEFSFGKMKFYLECHPNGKDQDSKSFMSLYLYKTRQTDRKSGNRVNTSTFSTMECHSNSKDFLSWSLL